MQTCTSKNTSINKTKLPAISKLIDWEVYQGKKVLDYGGGKYDNFKDWLKENHNVNLVIYDPYNRTVEENEVAADGKYDLCICSNVLCVIDSNEAMLKALEFIRKHCVHAVFTVYEGDKSGVGKYTKKDCFQRNLILRHYVQFFWECPVVTNNMIIARGSC